jgi:hypothetical protein
MRVDIHAARDAGRVEVILEMPYNWLLPLN